MWNKKEGRGKCRLQHRQGTWHSEIQFVDTGTWALRWEVAGERIFTPSTKSTDRGAPHGSVPAQALLNISVSNLNDRTESTLCKFAASLQTMQNREERLVGQVAVLPFGGIWAGWRNKPAGNSQRLTGGNAKSYTWWTALQKKGLVSWPTSWPWARRVLPSALGRPHLESWAQFILQQEQPLVTKHISHKNWHGCSVLLLTLLLQNCKEVNLFEGWFNSHQCKMRNVIHLAPPDQGKEWGQ